MTDRVLEAAVDARMIDRASREFLLQDLPAGFRYSLPIVSRPIDQLRYDLMELDRTPRLIGLNEQPLVLWLRRAHALAMQRRAVAAPVFADALRERGAPLSAAQATPGPNVADEPRVAPTPEDSLEDAPRRWRYDYFVAYPPDQLEAVRPLVEAMRERGLAVFFDTDDLLPGDAWDERLPAAQRESRSTLVVMSGTGGRDYYMREEIVQSIDRYRQSGRPLIPVYLDREQPLDSHAVPYGLRRITPMFVDRLGGVAPAAQALRQLSDRDAAAEKAQGSEPRRASEASDVVSSAQANPLRPGEVEAGDLVDERYLLEGLLGRGATTSIWRATDRKGDASVVLKFLHEEIAADSTRREAFVAGIETRHGLTIPGLVPVLAPAREEAGHLFYVEPYVEGPDLGIRVRAGTVEPAWLLDTVARLGDTLAALHARSMVHGSLSPDDVLFDTEERPVLVELGLGQVTAAERNARVAFVAPEALDTRAVAPPCDQYSLAALAVFGLNNGKLPAWFGRAPERLIGSLGLTPEVGAVLQRALAFDPGDRFPTMAEMVSALAAAAPAGGGAPREAGFADPPPRPSHNPFTPGPALDGRHMPPGRAAEVNRILSQLRIGGSVLLLGPRRSGKTSILRHLEHRLAADEVPARLVLLEDHPVRTADEIAAALRPGSDRRALTRALEDEFTAGAVQAVFLVDEVGYLRDVDLDERPTAFGWLRARGQSTATFVYAGSTADWRDVRQHARKEPGSSFGNDVMVVPVGPISETAAMRFLAETAPDDVPIESDIMTEVVRRVGGWPFYLQVMGQAIVEDVRDGRGRPEGEVQGWIARLYRERVLRGSGAVLEDRWTALPTVVRRALLERSDDRLLLEVIAGGAEAGRAAFEALPGAVQDALYNAELYDGISGWIICSDQPLIDWAVAQQHRLRRQVGGA